MQDSVRIPVRNVQLVGELTIPPGARGVVLFAHGTGSSRLSPRNRLVAAALQQRGLGTLLFDLLTPGEDTVDELTGGMRFDIPLLADRLGGATDWIEESGSSRGLPIGYFGASTGAAAALIAAAERPYRIFAVVSRGGRPDLAGPALAEVRAPTLLLVGGADRAVMALNQQALDRLGGPKLLSVVAHATHLFEEPGALEQVARFAGDWFLDHLRTGVGARSETVSG